MRRKLVLGGLILAIAASAAVLVQERLAPSAPTPQASAPATTAGSGAQVAPDRLAVLPSREAMGRPAGEPFGSHVRTPPPSRAAAPPPAPVAPSAPPMPYRVAGLMVQDGAAQVVLAKGDRIITVREGDSLDDGYRVEAIKPDGVTLVYLPMNERQTLPLVSALGIEAPPARAAAPAAAAAAQSSPQAPANAGMAQAGDARPAQLRFEGPEKVVAGSNFNVALKVTSEQPVRASPLQLSYDAKLLEPVGVRAGDFFAGGSFSYRINPSGSIHVGALGSGEVASDAEFLVVTFRPIRAGTTELKLSSVLLQGATGRAIVHAQPASFRTAIQ
jgi:hypothetical protein